MRHLIPPEEYKGSYSDVIQPEDLLIMGKEPEDAAGSIRLSGGIYEGLWRLSLETGLGMIVDVRRIPLTQQFINDCNRRDINPYEQPMDDKIYIAHPLSSYHLRRDISVIGYLTREIVCRIINGDRESYLRS